MIMIVGTGRDLSLQIKRENKNCAGELPEN